jgi:GDSL-like Lipase/Acylhydrolase
MVSGIRSDLLDAKNLAFACAIYFAIHSLTCECSPASSPIPAIFSFGDANVETGNNNFIDTNLKTNFPPFGETYFGAPSGRVTDGRITLDFLATYLNLPFVPPYLHPGNNFMRGANFGSGGAEVLRLADVSQNRGIPLSDQLTYFFELKNRARNLSIPESTFEDALYYIQIGEVDYIEFTLLVETVGFLSATQSTVMDRVLSTIEVHLNE